MSKQNDLAAELREARKRVRELESEIEVRDNSANLVFDTLKAALPNRGFHSEMEAAEAAAKEIAELRRRERSIGAEEELRRIVYELVGSHSGPSSTTLTAGELDARADAIAAERPGEGGAA